MRVCVPSLSGDVLTREESQSVAGTGPHTYVNTVTLSAPY